jgi:hypothetical protein
MEKWKVKALRGAEEMNTFVEYDDLNMPYI